MTDPGRPRTVVIIRHAHAGNHSAPNDHERPLDGRGRREAVEAGRWLASTGRRLDTVLVSSAVRTRQTWELVSAELSAAPDATIEPRIYESDLDDLVDLLGEHAHGEPDPAGTDGSPTIALVGHNPALSALACALSDDAVELSPGAIAIVEIPSGAADTGRLVASWRPDRP